MKANAFIEVSGLLRAFPQWVWSHVYDTVGYSVDEACRSDVSSPISLG